MSYTQIWLHWPYIYNNSTQLDRYPQSLKSLNVEKLSINPLSSIENSVLRGPCLTVTLWARRRGPTKPAHERIQYNTHGILIQRLMPRNPLFMFRSLAHCNNPLQLIVSGYNCIKMQKIFGVQSYLLNCNPLKRNLLMGAVFF